MGEETCLDCGREINGPLIRTPDGDTYHLMCLGVEYPEECGTESRFEILDEKESPLYDFFEFLDDNPYESLMTIKEKGPEKYVKVNQTHFISLFGREIFSVNTVGSTDNITPLLLQAVAFGWAMERDYPAFADEDELYPDGDARVDPEEEELSSTGD